MVTKFLKGDVCTISLKGVTSACIYNDYVYAATPSGIKVYWFNTRTNAARYYGDKAESLHALAVG